MKIKINDLWIKVSDCVFKHSKIIGNIFWLEEFLSYIKISNIISQNTDPLYEDIWYNQRVKINKKSIFLKSYFFNTGIACIADLFCYKW